MTSHHKPVLARRVIEFLKDSADKIVVDCTVGEGGHSELIMKEVRPSLLIGMDADQTILEKASQRLKPLGEVDLICKNFIHLREILEKKGIPEVRAILIDLGISMFHYKESGRGFSFSSDEKLDMRVATGEELTAYSVVNGYSEDKLKKVFWAYGEERFSMLIARRIVEARNKKPIVTASELAEIVSAAVPKKFHQRIHPATRIFQAIRIEVNSELDNLEKVLDQAVSLLENKGRLLVITFHSLEDRIVKHKFQELSEGKITDELRGTRAEADYKILTKKPVIAGEQEINDNPASRSAKLRVLEKI